MCTHLYECDVEVDDITAEEEGDLAEEDGCEVAAPLVHSLPCVAPDEQRVTPENPCEYRKQQHQITDEKLDKFGCKVRDP